MHTYYKPALDIPYIGRLVEGNTFGELTGELAEGEVLFELLERPDHAAYAVLLNSQETFDEFADLATTHPNFHLEGYFAVDWSDAEDGTDELPENWNVAGL